MSYTMFIDECRWLAVLDPSSEVGAIWRASLIDEMVGCGFGAGRAEQLVDSAVRRITATAV